MRLHVYAKGITNSIDTKIVVTLMNSEKRDPESDASTREYMLTMKELKKTEIINVEDNLAIGEKVNCLYYYVTLSSLKFTFLSSHWIS